MYTNKIKCGISATIKFYIYIKIYVVFLAVGIYYLLLVRLYLDFDLLRGATFSKKFENHCIWSSNWLESLKSGLDDWHTPKHLLGENKTALHILRIGSR